jgi:DegV family protein with EDD domain
MKPAFIMRRGDMKNLHIVTDSNCHIPSTLCHELDIHVVPLPFVWNKITYLDNVDMGPREFYSKLRNSKSIPTTSGPTPGSFKDKFESLSSDGRPILAILVGRVFSITFTTANLAKDMLPNVDVTIINSDSTTMGLGFQVLAAARAAREGKELDEVISIVKRVKDTCGVVFSVSNLDYLRRGGRISHIQRFLASTLNVVPIMELKGGPIKPVEHVRNQKVVPRILDLVAERLVNERPIRMAVVHADAEARAWELAKEVRNRFDPDELITSELNPVLGIHAGPDALGLAYASGV